MKKVFFIVLALISLKSLKSFSQYPNGLQTIGNDSALTIPKGALKGRLINHVFIDTADANLQRVRDYPGAQIFTSSDEKFWLRNSTATMWMNFVVGATGQDTVYVADDLYVTWEDVNNDGTLKQVIHRLRNDGLISPGIVWWSGTGLKFYKSPSVYQINGILYSTGLDSVTLAPADPTLPRIDAFYVDTIPDFGSITGTLDANPVTPQGEPAAQIVLATILLNAGDTIPTSIVREMIYNEHTEWATSTSGTLAIDFDDVANPYNLVKDIRVTTYSSSAGIVFTKPGVETIDLGKTLTIAFYSNGRFNNRLALQWYSGGTLVSNNLTITAAHGLNINDSNRYQLISIPLSAWTWTSGATTLTRLRILTIGADNAGSKGFYLDFIQLQSGITNIPPGADYSNKLDSVTITKTTAGSDTLNVFRQWIKGISKIIGTVYTGGTSGGGGSGISEVVAGYGLSNINDSTIQADSLLLLTRLMAASLYQPHITLTTTGTSGAATFIANTLNVPQYSGGGTTDYETQTASGSTAFTFTSVPASMDDYIIFVNGSKVRQTTDYTTAGNVVTIPTIVTGDSVEYQRIK